MPATNFGKVREWLQMATKELERAFRDFKLGDPASCAFRSQLAGEKLTKSLLLLFGVQFEKTQEPAVLLGRYLARAKVSADGLLLCLCSYGGEGSASRRFLNSFSSPKELSRVTG